MESIISKKQLNEFKRDGFLKLESCFNKKEIEEIKNWTTEIKSFKETPGKWMMYFEKSLSNPKSRILNRVENIEPYHSGFKNLFRSKMLKCVEQLFESSAVLFKDKINFKMPGGSGFKAHQDVQAGWDRYCKLHITALVSVDAANKENGCLELSKGKHQDGIIGKRWVPLEEDSLDYISCPTNPGDVVFFDSYCPHRSKPNNTDEPRRVLYITYNKLSDGDHRSKYFSDKRLYYPQDCERDPNKKYEFLV